MTASTLLRRMRPLRFVAASVGTIAACAALPPLITVLATPTNAQTTWADYKDSFDMGVAGTIIVAVPLVSLLTFLVWPLIAYVVNRFKPLTFWRVVAGSLIALIPWAGYVGYLMLWDDRGALKFNVVAAALGYTSVPFVSLCLFYYFYLRHVYARPADADAA